MNKKIIAAILGAAIALNFVSKEFSLLLIFVVLLYFIYEIMGDSERGHSSESTPRPQSGDDSISETIVAEAKEAAQQEVQSSGLSSLSLEYHLQIWSHFEKEMDAVLAKFLILISERVHPNSALIFLPAGDGTYKMRSHLSNDPTLDPSVTIVEGGDLIGSYLKEGISDTVINGISPTQDLAYYSKKGRVQSLAIAPLKAVTESGFIVVDNRDDQAFNQASLNWLIEMGEIMGNFLYYGYLYQQHKLIHEEITAVSEHSQKFMASKSVDELLETLVATFRDSFNYARLSVSLKDEEEKNGKVVVADGDVAEQLIGLDFDLEEVSIANIFMGKQSESKVPQVLNRTFSNTHYEVRYSQKENRIKEFRSFVALPIGVGKVRGLMLLESLYENGFNRKDIQNMSMLTDIAAIAMEKMLIIEKQEMLAIRDGLTGLYNHRQFERLLHESIARSHRLTAPAGSADSSVEKVPVALVLTDIDHFKMVNDTHGHRFGDHVLERVAKTLESGIREGVDFAARYGGEEFALILYGSSAEAAYETANRVRESIEAIKFKTPNGEDYTVTMSFGIAMYDSDAKKQEELIQKSDKALYRAKEGGRNRVELYTPLNN